MLQLTIEKCSRTEVEMLSSILEEKGAVSVTYMDREDTPILEPELGTTPLWDDVIIHALYEDKQISQDIHALLMESYPHLSFAFEDVPEKDWERICIEDLKPMQFGERLWVCPTWHNPIVSESIILHLDPGLAFGTGMHPTTRLCLTWLEKTDLKQKHLIDYGCGSGILGLAALKLGASHVHAVDIDDQALIATRQNAKLNHLSSLDLSVSCPELLEEKVDLLIANILLAPLISLKNDFHQLLKPEGILVVSGILVEQEKELLETYKDRFLYQETMADEGWAMMVFSSGSSVS